MKLAKLDFYLTFPYIVSDISPRTPRHAKNHDNQQIFCMHAFALYNEMQACSKPFFIIFHTVKMRAHTTQRQAYAHAFGRASM